MQSQFVPNRNNISQQYIIFELFNFNTRTHIINGKYFRNLYQLKGINDYPPRFHAKGPVNGLIPLFWVALGFQIGAGGCYLASPPSPVDLRRTLSHHWSRRGVQPSPTVTVGWWRCSRSLSLPPPTRCFLC